MTGPAQPGPRALRVRYLRPALIAVLALDLVALAGFAVRVETVTRTTTTPAAQQSVVVAPPLPPAAPVPVAPVAAVPLPDTPAVPAAAPAPAKPTPTPTPVPAPAPVPSEPPTEPGEPAVRIAPCPVEIAEPTTSGGLKSLIDFAPAFGPFSAEAFAAAAAYEPLLQVIGPLLAQYPRYAPVLQPLLAPLLSTWEAVLDSGFAVLGPLYAPYRPQLLQAEADLAAALAPYARELAGTPLAGCLVELQAALLEGPEA